MASSPKLIEEQVRKTKPPITASPAFRWVVALWFAALLGVGSLIVPVILLERASLATGLAAMLPQAAPPLGFTARALIAGVGTVGGAMLGLVLARLIARDKPAKPARASRRPLSATEDLAEFTEIDEPAAETRISGRRRALAIEVEEGPSDFLTVAPLPGTGKADDFAEFTEFAEEARAEPEQRQTFVPAGQGPDLGDEQPFELDASAELTDDQAAAGHDADEYIPPEPHFERQEFVAVAEASEPVVEIEEPVAEPRPAMEPLTFSPPSMARPVVAYDEDEQAEDEFAPDGEAGSGYTQGDAAQPESEEDVSDKQIFEAPAGATPASDHEVDFVATADAADEAVGEGLVQLVQRLGATLEKHREWSAEQAAAMPAAAAPVMKQEAGAESPVPEDFDPAAADEAAQAMAAWFGSPAAKAEEEPAAATAAEAGKQIFAAPEVSAERQQYAPFANTLVSATVDDDEEEEDDEIADLAASFSLPLAKHAGAEDAAAPRAFDKPPVAEAAPEAAHSDAAETLADDEEDHSADSDNFASLNPFASKGEDFVRIDEPEPEADSAEPAVLFPGQESRRTAAPAARAFDPPAGQADKAPARAERPKPSNDDNERALREALMNLQRMSK